MCAPSVATRELYLSVALITALTAINTCSSFLTSFLSCLVSDIYVQLKKDWIITGTSTMVHSRLNIFCQMLFQNDSARLDTICAFCIPKTCQMS